MFVSPLLFAQEDVNEKARLVVDELDTPAMKGILSAFWIEMSIQLQNISYLLKCYLEIPNAT